MAFDVDAQIARAVAQGDQIHALMNRVRSRMTKRVEARDRIRHDLQDALVFQQSQNTTQQLVFNVPQGHGFECVRLMLLPEVRSVTIDAATTGPEDLVFRPVAWIGAGTQVIANSALDAQLEMGYIDPDGNERRYQNNKPFFASQCFSSPLNLNGRTYDALVPALANCCQYDGNSYGRGLEFEPFLEVRPGTPLTMQVTPVFSGTKQTAGYGSDGRLYEYRIRGIVEGYKRVRQ